MIINNINIPDNIDYITSSLFGNKKHEIIYSNVQESNYSLKRHTYPRYDGSKVNSKTYNKYNRLAF